MLSRISNLLADRYRVERELGAGGMATVYLAHDLKHDRAVAIKILRDELAASIGPERFLLEIKTTARLAHPHILPLHDSGEVNGTLYYVMPYVEGETLRAKLDRDRSLPVPEAIAITKAIADALSYAHAHGVVHRDIKPENIFLQSGHALVADFGIARATSSSDMRMTTVGVAIGTPAYMSPEQSTGEDVDARSDQYALASMLYEMLTAIRPLPDRRPSRFSSSASRKRRPKSPPSSQVSRARSRYRSAPRCRATRPTASRRSTNSPRV